MIQRQGAAASDADAARTIVAGELATYLAGQRLAEVTPTVTALRQRAADVVEAELMRLDSRLPGLDDPQRDEGCAHRAPRRGTSFSTPRPCASSNWRRPPAATPYAGSAARTLRTQPRISRGAVGHTHRSGGRRPHWKGPAGMSVTTPRSGSPLRIGTRGSLLATTQAVPCAMPSLRPDIPPSWSSSRPRATSPPIPSRRSASECSRQSFEKPCWTTASTLRCIPTRTYRPRRTRVSSSRRFRHAKIRVTRSSPVTVWSSGSSRPVPRWEPRRRAVFRS